MPQTLGLRRVRRSGGKIYLQFSDKIMLEFDSVTALKEWAQQVDGDTEMLRDLLRRLLVRWWLHRDSDGQAAGQVEGKLIRIDLGGATLLEVI